MADSSVTLYPGDQLTITVSTGQAPDGPGDPPVDEPVDLPVDADPAEAEPDGEAVAFTASGDVAPAPSLVVPASTPENDTGQG